ncbi:hypothetical protein SAMN05428642_102419 [Flaviramulus basaltis]|uniref:O-Glycosyl hydrolase n=1 Tax=Flaviramulus basaltis TaxID=369401 RepID=A0A1K2IHH6_9FLAO|nr:hypothetical protein [Flaviramulus basaltis]SFZ91901.1 hypothetical protein SAMN05428642_102419 [Flaviramulus basaltis]
MKFKLKIKQLLITFIALYSVNNFAQTEFTTWGNLTGIRIDNQLMEFNSSLVVIDTLNEERATVKEGQKILFKRVDDAKIFSYEIDSLSWNQTIKTPEKGKAEIAIDFSSKVDTIINGAFFRLNLPKKFDETTIISFKSSEKPEYIKLSEEAMKSSFLVKANSIKIEADTRQLHIDLKNETFISIKADTITKSGFEIMFLMASKSVTANQVFSNIFNITATGDIETEPVNLKVFPKQQGQPFDGIGGNFRLQNPNVDPQVIDYCLENLRVAWSRLEMPWQLWHPDLDKNPIEEAKKGNIHPKVKAAMEMAQRLDKKGIPVILAAWYGPDWAIIGERARGENPDGTRGNALDLTKKEAIYKSIASYIKYLKEVYSVKTVMFSFNEADLGIEIRQTPKEHNEFIKEMGMYLESQGLDTQFFLGDTADANGWNFTTLGSTDPETQPYIGGVSFHSWRGYTNENLLKWHDISNRVNKPLFVGEGSIDAGGWRYPQIFEEPTYALDEIDAYIKILNISQPKTILQWQLTSDYSVLSGGGVFGNTKDELHPTQRFFNLKQLGETPKGLFAIPITTTHDAVTCAALGDASKGNYVIHLVNKGATRIANLTGLPLKIKSAEVYVTNIQKSYQKVKTVPVKNGELSVELEGASFISLFAK